MDLVRTTTRRSWAGTGLLHVVLPCLALFIISLAAPAWADEDQLAPGTPIVSEDAYMASGPYSKPVPIPEGTPTAANILSLTAEDLAAMKPEDLQALLAACDLRFKESVVQRDNTSKDLYDTRSKARVADPRVRELHNEIQAIKGAIEDTLDNRNDVAMARQELEAANERMLMLTRKRIELMKQLAGTPPPMADGAAADRGQP